MFEAITINPEYRYYYSGNDGEPDAIMGLQKDYALEGGYWHEIELTEKQLRWWIESLWSSRNLYIDDCQGYEVLTPDGSVAGVYYSRLEWLGVKYPGGNRIYVSEPAPAPWKQQENTLDDHGSHTLRK